MLDSDRGNTWDIEKGYFDEQFKIENLVLFERWARVNASSNEDAEDAVKHLDKLHEAEACGDEPSANWARQALINTFKKWQAGDYANGN